MRRAVLLLLIAALGAASFASQSLGTRSRQSQRLMAIEAAEAHSLK